MFILDSLMISGIRWALETAVTAAEAEMNDDASLREQLLEAEMRREMGEISEAEFEDVEADLLARIREIKERREGGSGPLAFDAQPLDMTGDTPIQVEASVSGDFHDAGAAPHTTVIEPLGHGGAGHLIQTSGTQSVEVLDMEPGDVALPASASTGKTVAGKWSRTGTGRSRRAAAPAPAPTARATRPSGERTAPRNGPVAGTTASRPPRTGVSRSGRDRSVRSAPLRSSRQQRS